MGTDIQQVFQKRTENGWEDVPHRDCAGRDYVLFAWLADICNVYNLTPLSSYRGLPSDFEMIESEELSLNGYRITCGFHPVSNPDLIALHAMDCNNRSLPGKVLVHMGQHGFGWLLDDEILNASLPLPSKPFSDLKCFVNEIRRLKEIHGSVRVVFGFDS